MYLFFECCSILFCVSKVSVWMLFCASCVCCACGGQKRTWILWNWSYRFLSLCGCWELIPGPSNKRNVKRACVTGVLRHKWGICVVLSQNSGVIVEEGRRDCTPKCQGELEQNHVLLAMTGPKHSRFHSSCGCLQEIKPVNIPAWRGGAMSPHH